MHDTLLHTDMELSCLCFISKQAKVRRSDINKSLAIYYSVCWRKKKKKSFIQDSEYGKYICLSQGLPSRLFIPRVWDLESHRFINTIMLFTCSLNFLLWMNKISSQITLWSHLDKKMYFLHLRIWKKLPLWTQGCLVRHSSYCCFIVFIVDTQTSC